MDLNLLRTVMTLAAFAVFVGIVWWAYSPSRKARLDAQAASILDEERS
ncbi:MAG: cbb3-type cytochrome c oxidase subunit 3 [Betaproteobacteria bacterium]|nr:cbb3-type cytochrome c oxidase subunit 3 [Betaproteobacteria bacterium]